MTAHPKTSRNYGPIKQFEWLVCDGQLREYWRLIPRYFKSRSLVIACYNSGPLSPTKQETGLGWQEIQGGLLSPPLMEGLSLPQDQFDEWWIFDSSVMANRLPRYNCFVNHIGWTLQKPQELESYFHPTWERGSFDWLIPIQQSFWEMVKTYDPLAFISGGDKLIIATRHSMFLDAVEKIASP